MSISKPKPRFDDRYDNSLQSSRIEQSKQRFIMKNK